MNSGAAELLVIAGLILVGLILLAWGVSARVGVRERRARESGLYPSPGSATDADVGRLLDAGEKMLAIKLYRELYRVDRKSARAAVDELTRTERRGL